NFALIGILGIELSVLDLHEGEGDGVDAEPGADSEPADRVAGLGLQADGAFDVLAVDIALGLGALVVAIDRADGLDDIVLDELAQADFEADKHAAGGSLVLEFRIESAAEDLAAGDGNAPLARVEFLHRQLKLSGAVRLERRGNDAEKTGLRRVVNDARV